ncbi:MAG: hypothetical protein EAZ85_00195 [Bacteroidetes bacterium]|nr:MAG: hypothetical protein EAZ85_00195 [Bacteroidota bacterium]TAG90573.1 MAG: hypothetical protein EAZ20_04100 [Bacteroidota bacterium]
MYYLKFILIFSVFLVFNTFCSFSQSLIVGIPSADIAEKGNIEITHESQVNFWEKPNSWNSFNFFCYGINKRTEATLAFNNMNSSGSDNLSLGLGGKHVIPLTDSKWETKITAGSNLLYSIPRKDIGYWVYSHLSFRLPKTKTRLTGGLSYGTEQSFGFRRFTNEEGVFQTKPIRPLSVMLGFEQHLFKNVSLVADWYSGTHDLAALITAIQIDIKHHVLIFGYKLPNNLEKSGHALVLEFMISLPTRKK